jgi:4-hydroxy-2-oxovalerate aldolase
MATRITVVDSTLRDGSHAKRHQFTEAEVRAVAAGLERARVPIIEISHGDGVGGSSINYGYSLVDEYLLMEAALKELKRTRLAILMLPGVGIKADLVRAAAIGVQVARIATHCTEADISEQHMGLARSLGMTVVGFLMMAHMAEPAKLAEQALIMAAAGADVVYVTDSAGALLPNDTSARVAALRAALPSEVEVGFHGHQNLYLGVANSLVAIEAGATWIDGCTCGMGAGAGNTPTEVLAAVCDRLGIETGIDVFTLMDVAEDVVKPVLPRPQVVDRAGLVLGYAGVYSSFLLHAERAAARFGVSSKDILVEVGRQKAVGGQEDLIIEIASALAAAKAAPKRLASFRTGL